MTGDAGDVRLARLRVADVAGAAAAWLAAADPVMAAIVADVGPVPSGRRLAAVPDDHWSALAYGIIGQRSSEKQTIAVVKSLVTATGATFWGAADVIALGEALAPLLNSFRKADQLLRLAEQVTTGSLDLAEIATLADDEVVARLVALPGVGPWTAEQFLVWHLERPDALPAGDPAVRAAVAAAYGRDAAADASALTALAEAWRPYRGVAGRYLLVSRYGPGMATDWPFAGGRPRRASSAGRG